MLSREVTLSVNGVRTRPDAFVEFPNGTRGFIEVKTGPWARLTANQIKGFPGIRTGGAIPRGANALKADLESGVPLGTVACVDRSIAVAAVGGGTRMGGVQKKLDDAVKGRLLARGFRKRAGLVYTREAVPGVLDWVSFNTASKYEPAGRLEINPIVAVRHQQIARMVADLRGTEFHAYAGTTLGTSIGYVMPEGRYLAWRWSVDEDDVIDQLMGAIERYGLSFIEGHRALSCVVADDMQDYVRDREFDIPVAHLLLGDADRAAELVRVERNALSDDRTDPWAVMYRRFADALLASGPAQGGTVHDSREQQAT